MMEMPPSEGITLGFIVAYVTLYAVLGFHWVKDLILRMLK